MRAALVGLVIVAQAGLPPRGAVAPAGTAVLFGVVTSGAASPQPVRHVTIRLSSANSPSVRVAGTDDEGKFAFDALPAGTYTVSAMKPGYVQTFYGSRHPGRGPGVPVAVADGQRVSVAIQIVPGAVITGTIVDARGTAAPNVPVAVVAVGATTVRGVTDDRGAYRVFGLAPGEYVVTALPRVGSGAGGRGTAAGEIAGITDAEARWARGAGAPAAVASTMPAPGRPVAYAPVFYPGTTDISSAASVTIGVGEERSGVNLTLQIVQTARVSGTLLDPAGQAVTSASVFLYPRRRDQPSPADALVASGALTLPRAVVSASGFALTGVSPGEYTIVARSGPSSRGAPPPPGPVLWSISDLTVVDGRDQTDLVLRLAPGLKLSGTIAFEHTTLAPPADMSAIDLSLQASGSYFGFASASRASVAANGAFTFSSIVPWMYTLKATPPGAAAGARWTLKSAILNGRDLADSAFEVKAGSDVTGLAITFTDRAAQISGRLVDAGGRPITRYSIIVFPTDRALWLPSSRRIRAAPPATDGSFTVAGLPAGEYAIAAAEDVDASDLADPAFLTQLLASAYKVTLADGEQRRQDLRIAR